MSNPTCAAPYRRIGKEGREIWLQAENSRQANKLAQAACAHAESGGKIMHEAVTAMQVINESSRKIADINGVIDAIAFQTNLLALNAAVEAAGIEQVGRAVASMDEGTQQNAALVEEAAAASESIAQQVRELNSSVNADEQGASMSMRGSGRGAMARTGAASLRPTGGAVVGRMRAAS